MRRKAIASILLWCAPAFGWDAGFDFRFTASFATDPSYAVFAGLAAYPTVTTINGQQVTFGWESEPPTPLWRDRSTGGDPRLAGIRCQYNDGATAVFRVDLPTTGTYSIGLAVGDGFGFDEYNHVQITSANTPVLSINAFTPGNMFIDAAGSQWNGFAWPASSVAVQKTFGSTILRLRLGGAVDSAYSCVAHLRITSVQPAVAPRVGAWQFLIQ